MYMHNLYRHPLFSAFRPSTFNPRRCVGVIPHGTRPTNKRDECHLQMGNHNARGKLETAKAKGMEALQIALGFGCQSKEMEQHSDTVSVCHAQRN